MERRLSGVRAALERGALAAACGGFLAPGAPASGIIRRHDVPVAEHRRVTAPAGAVVQVNVGQGTLIAPRWVLTAAHIAQAISPMEGVVRVNGKDVRVRRVVWHPTWIGGELPGYGELAWVDLALIEIVEEVEGATTIPIHRARDEAGRVVTHVGAGGSGDGTMGEGNFAQDGVMRECENVVASAEGDWLRFTFDAPPAGLPREGVSGPGDSGSPALLRDAATGAWAVAAVSSRSDDGGNGQYQYGSTDVCARVSTNAPWIDAVMSGEDQAGARTLVGEEWPTKGLWPVVREFFEAVNAQDAARLERFERERLGDDAGARSPGARAADWLRLRGQEGEWRPVLGAAPNADNLIVAVEAGDVVREFVFGARSEKPGMLRTIGVRRLSPGAVVALRDVCPLPEPGLEEEVARRRAAEAARPVAPAPAAGRDDPYVRVGIALVECINAGETERESYRALFTDAGWEGSIDWWHNMFRVQREKFGSIRLAYAPSPGEKRLGRMAYSAGQEGGRTRMVLFDEPVGGALTFELSAEGKIVKSNVFISQQMALYEGEEKDVIFRRGAPAPAAQ